MEAVDRLDRHRPHAVGCDPKRDECGRPRCAVEERVLRQEHDDWRTRSGKRRSRCAGLRLEGVARGELEAERFAADEAPEDVLAAADLGADQLTQLRRRRKRRPGAAVRRSEALLRLFRSRLPRRAAQPRVEAAEPGCECGRGENDSQRGNQRDCDRSPRPEPLSRLRARDHVVPVGRGACGRDHAADLGADEWLDVCHRVTSKCLRSAA